MIEPLPHNREIWLTSFWGFDPSLWGGVGFTDANDRARFLSAAPSGSLLAIYVTKHKGPSEIRGKLVGFLEITHEIGNMEDLTSPSEWAHAEKEAGTKGKWVHGVKASRAWSIIEEDWQDVDELFPQTYADHNKQLIGSRGVPIHSNERQNIYDLNVREVSVYGQSDVASEWIGQLGNALTPSNAIPPSKKPVIHKEADGPKRLYILRLQGNESHFLGREMDCADEQYILKVGFSVSPSDRCRQIQSSYPSKCAFKWTVVWSYPPQDSPAYPNAKVAIAGEDAMKKRLAEDGEILGGEFFLADDGLFIRAQSAGKYYADKKKTELFGLET